TVPHAGRSHMKPQASEAFAAFLGLDWADAKHDVCLHASGTEHREFLSLEPSPEAMNAWVQTLRTRFHGQPVAVCLELNTGPIVSALRHDDCLVLLPVHPLTVAKYREALTPEPGARRPHRCCTPGRAPPQTPRQAHPTQPPQPDDARLGATRRTSPASGR